MDGGGKPLRIMNQTPAIIAAVAAVGLAAGWREASRHVYGKDHARATSYSRVTKRQFDRWMVQLSNWGRWGKDDERGALNLITSETSKQAAALAKTGITISLANPITREKPASTPEAQSVNREGTFTSQFLIDGPFLYERQEVDYHGGAISHFDALCHVSRHGKSYNGFVFKEIVTKDRGCTKLAVDSAKDGIVTRGVLLDLPGMRVERKDIEAWEHKTGVRIRSGDALLLRTHQPGVAGGGGYDPSMLPLLKERDVALLGSDSSPEGGTIPGVAAPIHQFTLVALGMNVLDNLALNDLAAAAARLKRWELMLVVEPLRVEKASGSLVNPVAIF
jgi:kynurenine formamidase